MDKLIDRSEHFDRNRSSTSNPAQTFKADHMRNGFITISVTPTVTTVAQKLKELLELKIQAQGENVGVLDVYKWLNVAALEVMGQAGFGYSFDALEPNHEDVEYLNASHRIARFRRAIAAKVYHIKKEDLDKMMLDSGEHLSRDVMSSLLLQNNIVAPEEAMDEEEVISQVNALFLAAHDSTSAALARTIHVLAEHPDVQSKLRDEVCEAYEMFGEELDYDQLNSLLYLDAVCRESLRLYAPAPFLIRIAQEDWSIPLLYPSKSSDDQETITHVSVKKGTCIHLSLDAANRDVRTWGEDTNVFRPSRWLDSTQTNLQESRMPGIYSPLMTFSGGPRACIGFKFSQLEMKLLLAKLISSFKFELSDTQITWRLDSVPKPKAATYGLPSTPEELDEEQQGILSDLSPGAALRFRPPQPLGIGRLVFDLDTSAGLAKTCTNFISLCKGDKGVCKNAPNKPLHYKGTAIHRIAKDFVAQGGDVTRNDGSGGESIYGGKFSDAKEGLKAKPEFGSLAMANSGKNSNTSQFFIILTNDPTKLAKIAGKYVIFGKARISGEGEQVLQQLGALAGADERPLRLVWVESCGVLS
ncbi:cytochrome P450-dit2 [Ceratobasidium sp. 423]|nr:cytochrome P450-dit2 [Ceratobasidium sp. 423]